MNDDVATRVAYLKAVPFLQDVPDDDLRALAERMDLITVPADSLLFDIDDPGDAMYIVESGTLEIQTEDETPVAVVRSGSLLGEVGFLTQKSRKVRAQALSDARLWMLRYTDFEAVVEQRPQLAMAVARALSRRQHRDMAKPSVEGLSAVALFKGLDEKQLADVASYLEGEYFNADTTIYVPGNPADKVYVVARGRVSVRVPSDGGMRELYQARSGEFFGEEEVLNNEPRRSAAVALEPTTCWSLRAEHLDTLVNTYPRIALNMARLASQRILSESGTTLPAPTRPAAPVPADGPSTVPASAQPLAPVPAPVAEKAAPRSGGLLAWYRYLDTGTRVRLIAFIVLLIWLVGVSVPAMARSALRNNRMYANIDHTKLQTTVIGNSPAGVPLATELELQHPTPTATPPATPTPGQ